ncbi:LAGLIDADG family homing endonuclease [Methanopyrus kandleri]|uniref:Homing endonuclease LAGLIDADG domain-containing protein n=1 Tax=Methanopyrus kandleri TaxID=2320 RepID=A0A832T640_9EURY|nr:LAGLIDADG family homing endonuclease [Methanopyrus kandleri]HII70224.1 hypothetical protein [Methanopyrus kandleri]
MVSLDYIAGFFDGEGSVVVRFVRDGRYRAGYRVSTKVVFVQKERDVLEEIHETLGMGHLYRRGSDGVWYLEIYRREDLREFVELIGNRTMVKRDALERLATVLELLEGGVHGSRDGLERIREVWEG